MNTLPVITEIARSASERISTGPWGASKAFFCSRKEKCLAQDAEETARALSAFCEAEIARQIAEYKATHTAPPESSQPAAKANAAEFRRRNEEAANKVETVGIDTGGNPVGTKAAAQAVAERKIAELQQASETKPVAPASPAKAPGISPAKAAILQAFAKEKKRLGKEIYYGILGRDYSISHSDEFTSRKDAERCLKQMQETPDPPALAKTSYSATDADLPSELTNTAPRTNFSAEVTKELNDLSLSYEKKSPDAVRLCLNAFIKGFYAGKVPKADADNIDALRLTLRLLRQMMKDYTTSIVESTQKAAAAGTAVANGVRKSLQYLEGKSLPAKMAFWDMAVACYPDAGGADWFGTGLVPKKPISEDDFIVLMRLIVRKVRGLADFLEYCQNNGLSLSGIVKEWAVDITTSPETGLTSLMAGVVKTERPAAAVAPEVKPAGPALVPPAQKKEEDPFPVDEPWWDEEAKA